MAGRNALLWISSAMLLVVLLLGCEREVSSVPPLERHKALRNMMGTSVKIVIGAPNEETAAAAMEKAFERIAEIENTVSSWRPGSEISRLNDAAGGDWVKISEETFEILEKALEYSRTSDGAFDVTVGPLIKLWKSAGLEGRLPEEAELRDAIAITGYDKLLLDGTGPAARLTVKGMSVDLGAIAKGYAVDQALATLRTCGITCALVDAGGDVGVMGGRPEGGRWALGIQHPIEEGKLLEQVIEMTDGAVATSGNYRRYVMIGGKRYSHITDPRTGRPTHAVPSVTIIAQDATTADGVATTVSVLGVEKGMMLVEKLPRVEALLVTIKNGELNLHRSAGFSHYEKAQVNEE